jgi:hypothetical protein
VGPELGATVAKRGGQVHVVGYFEAEPGVHAQRSREDRVGGRLRCCGIMAR